MKFLTDFTYRKLHGFARFPGDSTALVLIQPRVDAKHVYTHMAYNLVELYRVRALA